MHPPIPLAICPDHPPCSFHSSSRCFRPYSVTCVGGRVSSKALLDPSTPGYFGPLLALGASASDPLSIGLQVRVASNRDYPQTCTKYLPHLIAPQAAGCACVQLWSFNEHTAACTLIALLPTPAAEIRALAWSTCSLPPSPPSPSDPSSAPHPAPPPSPSFLLAAALSSGTLEVPSPPPLPCHIQQLLTSTPPPPHHPFAGVVHTIVSPFLPMCRRARSPINQRSQL